jgi:hypothetical protein
VLDKRKAIFRGLAKKATAHLYQKDGNKKRVDEFDKNERKHRHLKEVMEEHLLQRHKTMKYDGTSDIKSNVSLSEDESQPIPTELLLQEDEDGVMMVDLYGQRLDLTDDNEEVIAELDELVRKTGMRDLAKKQDRFLSVGMKSSKKKSQNPTSPTSVRDSKLDA